LRRLQIDLSNAQAVQHKLKAIIQWQRAELARHARELAISQLALQAERMASKQVRHDWVAIHTSRSWRFLQYLRKDMIEPVHFMRRVKNALGYLLRGDFKGLWHRWQSIYTDKTLKITGSPPSNWGILATPHTLFVAHLMAERLRAHGYCVDILTEPPVGFPHQMYIVVCAQMFSQLPPGEKRIVFQMEQSVSYRWFNERYLKILERSVAVLDYSLTNIEFLDSKGIRYPHVYYVPIGASNSYMPEIAGEAVAKIYDLLFYGDARSSPRRRKLLETLGRHFKVKVCSEVFGTDIAQEIRKAHAVINLHYYENALLETTRIQECLSLGVPVISESACDQNDYPQIDGAVIYFREGDEQDMIDVVRAVLADTSTLSLACACAVTASSQRFAFMFDRFLVAHHILSYRALLIDPLPLPAQASQMVLSMPETIERRRTFEANRPHDYIVFDGIRFRPGWMGCGLSYTYLARHALLHNHKRLVIMEDDALLPDDFEEKMCIIHAYLDTTAGQWDVFAGLIAKLHRDVQILKVETFQGIQFITIDRMVSTVCNIYGERGLLMLSMWDADNQDEQVNTIDRFLERQTVLRVVVTLPFLVGHREELHSTLWGFANEQYNEMISESERELMAKVQDFILKTSQPKSADMVSGKTE
jgi:hypothetical protein